MRPVEQGFILGHAMALRLDPARARRLIDHEWDGSVLEALCEYIRIPNQSPAFDPEWQIHRHMENAVALITEWIQAQPIDGLLWEVVRLERRTPLILVEVPGRVPGTVLLYGHIDKQPPMDEWEPGLGPWAPVLRAGRLYGRGAADDGYAVFAALTAIRSVQEQNLPHPRCLLLLEASEESGSPDLPAYIEALGPRIGDPSLVICLDSGCGDWERLWVTTSLRGLVGGTLRVQVLEEGVHSGAAGGIVPSSFRIARQLLGRIEDETTGAVLPTECHASIPADRLSEAASAAGVLGDQIWRSFPFAGSTRPVTADPVELILNRTWRPQLEIIGADGMPPVERAGNVLRPWTALRLSLRIPPTVDPLSAADALERRLTAEPPYSARVSFDRDWGAAGWNAPELAPWLRRALSEASGAFFGNDFCAMGEGGSIPFMAMLGAKFPAAQFVVTGVLGPKSNAHGPNEFLHIETARRLTGCVAAVLAEHPGSTEGG